MLQRALADLDAAYRNFFASVADRRKGPKVGRPRFRSRMGRRQAIRFTANARFKVLASVLRRVRPGHLAATPDS